MNVLKTALEAIELLTTDNSSEQAQAAAADARIKLANAMAVEPAAWMTQDGVACIPLYLHPPQQAKQVPMTDDEIDTTMRPLTQNTAYSWRVFARAVEAHHGIGCEP